MTAMKWMSLNEMPGAISAAFDAALAQPKLESKDRHILLDAKVGWQLEMLKVLYGAGIAAPVSKKFAEAYLASHIDHTYRLKDGKTPDLDKLPGATVGPSIIEYTTYHAAIDSTKEIPLPTGMTAHAFATEAVLSLLNQHAGDSNEHDPSKLIREVARLQGASNAYLRQLLMLERKLVDQESYIAMQNLEMLQLRKSMAHAKNELTVLRCTITRQTADIRALTTDNSQLQNKASGLELLAGCPCPADVNVRDHLLKKIDDKKIDVIKKAYDHKITILTGKLALKDVEFMNLEGQMAQRQGKIQALTTLNKQLEDKISRLEDPTTHPAPVNDDATKQSREKLENVSMSISELASQADANLLDRMFLAEANNDKLKSETAELKAAIERLNTIAIVAGHSAKPEEPQEGEKMKSAQEN